MLGPGSHRVTGALNGLLVLVSLVVGTGPVVAQLPMAELDELFPGDTEIDGWRKQFETDASGRLSGAAILGNASLHAPGFRLDADAIAVVIDADGPRDLEGRPPFKVLALGNIVLQRGRQSVRAESLLYDSRTRKAVLAEVRLRSDIEFLNGLRAFYARRDGSARRADRAPPLPPEPPSKEVTGRLVVAARRIEVEDFRRFLAEDVEITTCDFGVPHWKLGASEAKGSRDRPAEGEGDGASGGAAGSDDERRPASTFLTLDGVAIEIGGVPTLPIPDISWDTHWLQSLPLRSIGYSNSSKFGNRLDSVWDGNLLLPRDWRQHIDLGLRLEYLSKRGVGWGADLRYGVLPGLWGEAPAWDHYGEGLFYAIGDRGEDANDVEPDTSDRNRARLFHRTRLATGTLIDLEYAVEKDRNFLLEYYESEARGQKPPENLVYVRQPLGDDVQLALLAKKRMVSYRTVVERLPELTADLLEKPIGATGIDLDLAARASYLRFLPDDVTPLDSERNLRGDLRATVARAFGAVARGPHVKVRPFFETRFTAYDEDQVRGNAIERLALATGGRIGTHLSRTFVPAAGFLGFSHLRHSIDPEIRYRVVFENNVDPVELFTYDPIDTVDRVETLTLGLRNFVFGANRSSASDGAAASWHKHKLLESELEIDYFPDPGRDNFGDPWGDLEGELLINPIHWIGLFTDGRYDVETGGRFDELNSGVILRDEDGSSLKLEHRYRRHNAETLLATAQLVTSEKYSFEVYYEFDFRRHESVNQEYAFVRNFHRWSIVAAVEVDEGEEDDVRFSINFGPRELIHALRRDDEDR